MLKYKEIYLSVLVIANIFLYFTPVMDNRDVNNFDIAAMNGKDAYNWWSVVKDIGADKREIESLPNSTIMRKICANESGKDVEVLVVTGYKRNAIHSPTGCLPAQGWVLDDVKVIKARSDNEIIPINSITSHFTTKDGVKRGLIWYWYPVYKSNHASHLGAIIYNALRRIFLGRNYRWGMVRLSTSIDGKDNTDEIAMLKDLLENFYPEIKKSKDSVEN